MSFLIWIKDPVSDSLITELEKNIEYQKIVVNFNRDLHEFFDLDNYFHTLIFDYYNKKNVWKVIQRLATHYDRLRLIDALERINLENTIKQHIELIDALERINLENTIKQHIEIVNLIKEKNSRKINSLVNKHLFNFKEVINKFMEK